MQYGIGALSAVPLRAEPSDRSEMVNQLLFGESYQVLEKRKKWLRIRLQHDAYEGWLDHRQFYPVAELPKGPVALAGELIELISSQDGSQHFPVFMGALLPAWRKKSQNFNLGDWQGEYRGQTYLKPLKREEIIEKAFAYLNAPYLWGGRTPAGIDCSGFTQMIYRFAGLNIPRDASQQAKKGQVLSFIEEAEPADLAFFDNHEGAIVHVGLILPNNYILHASGKVRLDRLDQTGIFNAEERSHTHKLRVIKKIL